MKKCILVLVLLTISVLVLLCKADVLKSEVSSTLVKKLWEKKVNYYDIIGDTIITRNNDEYIVSKLNHVTGDMKLIVKIEIEGFRARFNIENDFLYVVYQISDYPLVQQRMKCFSLQTGKVIWTTTFREVETINSSFGNILINGSNLIFIQSGADKGTDISLLNKKDGSIIKTFQFEGYNYLVNPIVVEDRLIVSLTNDGTVLSQQRKSWLYRMDLKTLEVEATIEVPGIISGTSSLDNKILYDGKDYFVGSLVPGQGGALYRINNSFTHLTEIKTNININSIYKVGEDIVFSGSHGVGRLHNETVEYIQFESDMYYYASLLNDSYMLYWPGVYAVNLKQNKKKEILDAKIEYLWSYEDNVFVVLKESGRSYEIEGYKFLPTF